MNINSFAIIGLGVINNTHFGSSNIRAQNVADSFERNNYQNSDEIAYPQAILHKISSHKRAKALKVAQERCAKQAEKRYQARKEYSRLDSRAEYLIKEMSNAVGSNSRVSLNNLRKQVANSKLDMEKRKTYADLYIKYAQKLELMLKELETVQAEIDELHENGNAEKVNIPDLRINLSPENLDFYREQADFDPYSLISEE